MHQGVEAWAADGQQDGPLQPELASCFRAIEQYLDIDIENPWDHEDKAWMIANAEVDGEWSTDEANCEFTKDNSPPRMMSQDDFFLQLLETAVRR